MIAIMMTMKSGEPLQPSASRYKLPRPELAWLGVHLLFGWRRSFLDDCRTFLRTNPYPRRVEGIDNVPAAPPFVLVTNHYGRPGLRTYHSGMIVAGLIAHHQAAKLHAPA